MATLKEIIQREVNPFDSVTFTTGNFWTDNSESIITTVDSIHQEAIIEIEQILDRIIKDRFHRTRSVVLMGDSGCGKSYLLNRLKNKLNDRAFFVYIEPCLVKDEIWKHTLRQTVDSLMYVPEGEKESQLLLWLKGLSPYKDNGIKKKLLGAKNHFVRELRSIYPTSIYQPKDFFSVLYALTIPDLYYSACDWLRGNNISEDELKDLGVKNVIETEEDAKGIIGNFGRISANNKPIVLCFDQVELSAKSSDGILDISSITHVNTAFHNNNFKNFLVIISIVRDVWMNCQKNILLSDLARFNNQKIILKQINLEQVKALWISRLNPLHQQANPKPISPLEPLSDRELEEKYPGGKANLRTSLSFGGMLYEQYKSTGSIKIEETKEKDYSSAFNLLWQKEFNKTKNKITGLNQLSSPELIELLISAMKVLGIKRIQPKLLLSNTYAIYSFSYQLDNKSTVGILWNEDKNLGGFYHFIRASEKAIKLNPDIRLMMIRSQRMGTKHNKGYQIYDRLFNHSSHNHIKASLESVHYLKTYQKLVNDARSGDLVLNFESLTIEHLENLVRETKIFDRCVLLQDLGVISTSAIKENKKINKDMAQQTITKKSYPELRLVKEFLMNLVKHHKFLGEEALIKQAHTQFTEIETNKIGTLIQELVTENQISFIDPKAKPKDRLICLVT